MAHRGTPFLCIRLDMKTQRTLKQLGEIYGSPNRSAFVREMLTTMVSGDGERINAFNVRLFTRVGQKAQMHLALAEKRRARRAIST